MRAVAVLLVVMYHAGLPLHGGYVGVDVFFVISGFVITSLLARRAGEDGRLALASFYRKRVRRLLPALATMLSVVVLASIALQSPFVPQQNTAKVAAGASVSLANLVLYSVTGRYFDAQPTSIPLLHTWSLSVEEQFYLVFPTLLLASFWVAARRRRRGVDTAIVVLGLVTAVSFALSLRLTHAGSPRPYLRDPGSIAFYSSPTRAWEFAVGGLVALWFLRGTVKVHRPALVATAGAVLVIAAAFALNDATAFPGYAALIPVLGTALVIVGCLAAESRVGRLLSSSPLVWLGDVSYSWYLWHWPTIVFMRLTHWPVAGVVGAAISLPIAYLAYRFVETPIRYQVPRRRFATARLAAACLVVPIAASAILHRGAERGWGSERIRRLAAQVELPWGYDGRCHNGTPLGSRNLSPCTRGDGPGRPIILLGDSNAAQYGEGMEAAAAELGRPVTVGTAPFCPFVDIEVRQEGHDWNGCRHFVGKSLSWLVEQPGMTLFLAATNEMIAADEFTFADPVSGRIADAPAAKAALWSGALERTIRTLRSAGHEVIFAVTIPHFFAADDGAEPWWAPTRCNVVTLVARPERCSRARPLSQMDHAQRWALRADQQAVSRSGAFELNLRSEICQDGWCRTNVGERWVYRDGWHLSKGESRRLATRLRVALESSSPAA